jgi:ABC-type uncharacterized transport system permease subunit
MNNTLLYALAVSLLWASGGMAALGVFRNVDTPPWLYRLTVFSGLGASGCLLGQALFQPDGFHFGMLLGLMCVAWLAGLVSFVEGFFGRVLVLDMLVFPSCAFSFVLFSFAGPEQVLRMAGDTWFQVHLLIALAAYSLLGIAAGHALIMACQERLLHRLQEGDAQRRKLHEHFLDLLPPLMQMERMLFRWLWAGFGLLTLTLLSGFVFSEHLAGALGKLNHKTVFAIVSWLSFAVLLAGRHWRGWRGKVALRWCLGSYGVLLLAYFGTQFVLEFVLKRAV